MDDFEVQFNASARYVSGMKWPPYRYNASARVSYGHAAVITGFKNDDYTW
jgi:hypothetical protein